MTLPHPVSSSFGNRATERLQNSHSADRPLLTGEPKIADPDRAVLKQCKLAPKTTELARDVPSRADRSAHCRRRPPSRRAWPRRVAVNKSAILLRGGRGDEALGESGERNRWPAGLYASGLHLDLN